MHEQARLTLSFPAAGKSAGDLVSISEVKIHYATSGAANAALSFECANCHAPVSARIIQPCVKNRKTTPSSGFRASDPGQSHTCDREPSLTEASFVAHGNAAAHSRQGTAPERWVDPRSTLLNAGTKTSTASSLSAPAGLSSKGRNGSAAGRSVGQSQTIEKFAREWRQMSSNQRKATQLVAPWNSQGQGSYFSAFHPLGYFPGASPGVIAIYEGTARYVTRDSYGYDIELNECLPRGRPLHVRIPVACLSMGAAGGQLNTQLLQLHQAPASPLAVYVYALGTFCESPMPVPSGLVLEVEHPHMCWIK